MFERKFNVEISGSKPYLMNRFDPSPSNKKKGITPTVEEDCERALYKNSDGAICIPSLQIEASLINSAKEFKFQNRRTYKDLFLSGIRIEPELIPLEPQEYKPYSVGVVIQRSRIMKSRPRFENWKLGFTIVNSDERITDDMLKEILNNAGNSKGIGDWRPKFGLFNVEKFEKVKSL